MRILESSYVFFLAVGAMACSKPVSSNTVATQKAPTEAEVHRAEVESHRAEVTPTKVPSAGVTSAPQQSNPVRVVRQEGSLSYLAVDGDYLLRGMRFPEMVGTFERGQIVDFNGNALGHAVGYNDPAGIALTVYLYGTGGSAEEELKRALGDMAAHSQAPADLEFVGTGPISLEIEGQDVDGYVGFAHSRSAGFGSQAIVFSVGGRYLKFRVTAPIQIITDRLDEIRDVMISLGRPKAEL
jgi:hypothetical protein